MSKKKVVNVEKRMKDPVSEMKIHRENLKKQEAKLKLYDNFTINEPKKINFYTDKPNNNPFLLMKLQRQGRSLNGIDIDEKLDTGLKKTQISPEINKKLQTVAQVPKQKYMIPQTYNQEVGWLAEKANYSNKFIHKRVGCAETQYADNYYMMRHVSLFSNHSQK